MKKVFTLVAMLTLFGVMSAQEKTGAPEKISSFGVNSGITIFGGYSPLSIFADRMELPLGKKLPLWMAGLVY